MKNKELYFFLKTLLFSLLMAYLVLGKRGFTNSTIDINLHDSYFIIPSGLTTFSIILPIFFIAYLVKAIIRKLDVVIVNLISIILGAYIFIHLVWFNQIFGDLPLGYSGWTALPQFRDDYESNKTFWKIKTILIPIQIFLSIYLVFVGFKTIQIYNKRRVSS